MQVQKNDQFCLRAALIPTVPLKTDSVFVDSAGELGAAWGDVCEQENRLARYLTQLGANQCLVVGSKVWFLEKVDGHMVLMHGQLEGRVIKNAASRFEHDLGWVDAGIEELQAYACSVECIADELLRGEYVAGCEVSIGFDKAAGKRIKIVDGLEKEE